MTCNNGQAEINFTAYMVALLLPLDLSYDEDKLSSALSMV